MATFWNTQPIRIPKPVSKIAQKRQKSEISILSLFWPYQKYEFHKNLFFHIF